MDYNEKILVSQKSMYLFQKQGQQMFTRVTYSFPAENAGGNDERNEEEEDFDESDYSPNPELGDDFKKSNSRQKKALESLKASMDCELTLP